MNMLEKLVNNSQTAINEGVYDISSNLKCSGQNLMEKIEHSGRPVLITEIKFASPSLGGIRSVTDPVQIASDMVAGGASALSVLTQPHLFGGSPEYFAKIRQKIDAPMLMKDIIIDTIQVDAAKKIGADYILLIQSLYEKKYLDDVQKMIRYGHDQGLKVLLEAHTASEFKDALETDADLIGINNRNLDTLKIDLKVTQKILAGYKGKKPVISESGIESPEDIASLKRAGADAFLVGSSIMKSKDIQKSVSEMMGAF